MAIDISFLSGIVEHASSVRVICQIGQGDGAPQGVARWLGPGQKWPLFMMKWNPVRLAYTSQPPCLFAAATDGTIGYGYGGTFTEEQIDTSNEGPLGRGPIRDIRVIGSTLFACGMARQVYHREGAGRWVRHDAGVVAPLGHLEVTGFNAIDGVSERDLFAVGFYGEIWHCLDGAWSKEDSSTNVVLYRVRAVTDDKVFACGQKGLILKRGPRAWQEVAVVEGEPNLWGIEWFNGHLYVASVDGVYRLTDAGLEQVKIPGATTFAHLHANDGVMWSFGKRDLFWTRDGNTWTRESPII